MQQAALLKAAAAILALFAGAVAWASQPHRYVIHSYDEAMAAAEKSGRQVLLYFRQDRCSYCWTTDQLLLDDSVAARYSTAYHLVVVDMSKERRTEAPQRTMADRFLVPLAPTFVFLTGGGTHLCTAVGAIHDKADAIGLHDFVQSMVAGRVTVETPRRRPCGRLAAGQKAKSPRGVGPLGLADNVGGGDD